MSGYPLTVYPTILRVHLLSFQVKYDDSVKVSRSNFMFAVHPLLSSYKHRKGKSLNIKDVVQTDGQTN